MGGCRCTYRSCGLKSDGVTHMFHYPVFDKIRCHQWLVNAQRFDFLNLKVSQLKNRVVCEHHFRDDCFMNYMKDKLKCDAVPTEDGPYCKSEKVAKKEEAEEFPLVSEEIENDYLVRTEKRANYSVKYLDFLTSCDLSFLNTFNDNHNNTIVEKSNLNYVPYSTTTDNDIKYKKNELPTYKLNSQRDSSTCIVAPTLQIPSTKTNPNIEERCDKRFQSLNNSSSNIKIKTEPRVKILSEKKIKEPIIIPLDLETVSPSTIIEIPKKKAHNQSTNKVVMETKIPNPKEHDVCANFDNNVRMKWNENIPYNIELLPDDTEKVVDIEVPQLPVLTPPPKKKEQAKMTPLKNKISPQREAAIRLKRQFNMKLRDILESTLSNEKVNNIDEVISNEKINNIDEVRPVKENIKIEDTKAKNMALHLSSKPQLPSIHEYTIAYLEARMKRMEYTLLSRIDHNTKKISELASVNENKDTDKRDKYCQTHMNEEDYKRYLYKEMSKYLSPATNSKVYEELFIDKYSLHGNNVGDKDNKTIRETQCKRKKLR
ncbi:uncharacterized protein LOC126975986 [Leptidea sinapis]|uniref:uncharacterized protein LOC126975986 n=1 Tax=Leptidea sinapis TaxID=189913 RepID=UPI0021C2E5A7|nr:uncharacterized protein LOC126975986 [Leptidea sinapis]